MIWSIARRFTWPLGIMTSDVLIGIYRHEVEPYLGFRVETAGSLLTYIGVAWFGSRIFGFAMDHGRSQNRPYPKLFKDLMAVLFFFAALFASAASMLEQGLVGALAGSSLILAVLGFAVRNVVADTLSGVALGIEGPYRIGDWVDIDEAARGRVIEIGWRTTRLLTLDSTYVILPNSQIARRRITNYSAPKPQYRAHVLVKLSRVVSVEIAKGLLLEATASAKLIKSEPAPDVKVVELGPVTTTYALRFWLTKFETDADSRDEVLSYVDKVLRRARVPAPSMNVELAGSSEDFESGVALTTELTKLFKVNQSQKARSEASHGEKPKLCTRRPQMAAGDFD